MSRRSWVGLVIVAIAIVTVALTIRQMRHAAPAGPARTVRLFREPVSLTNFTITDMEGRTHSSADWKGKVVLINFWATWCPPCRAEIPDLIALQNRYRDELVIVGISEDEGPVEEVKKFVADQKMTYTVAMATPALRKIFKGVVALPTTFILDQEGRLAQKHVGLLNIEETEAEALVLSGLDKNASIERIENSDKIRLENAAQAKTLPGVDLTGLSEADRKVVVQALIDANCTCGCTLSVAECRLEDPGCPISLPLAKKIVEEHAGTH